MTHEQYQAEFDKRQAKFLAGYLAKIPNDSTYETWSKVGFLLHTITGGSIEGAHLFYGWSKQSHRHTDDGFVSFWRNDAPLTAMDLFCEMARGPETPRYHTDLSPALQQLWDTVTPSTIH
jgi:hypothetical protein